MFGSWSHKTGTSQTPQNGEGVACFKTHNLNDSNVIWNFEKLIHLFSFYQLLIWRLVALWFQCWMYPLPWWLSRVFFRGENKQTKNPIFLKQVISGWIKSNYKIASNHWKAWWNDLPLGCNLVWRIGRKFSKWKVVQDCTRSQRCRRSCL